MKKSRSTSYNLLCVAHPDDETIFFGGLIQRLARESKAKPWTVVCMTDGNADGEGKKRKRQFESACRVLGVQNPQWWGYADIFEKRLPVGEIAEKLRALPTPNMVFTHGIIGEYGHPHHQDVSFAVHTAFAGHDRVFTTSYNANPTLGIELDKKEFETKAKVLMEIYGSETQRFMNLLPATGYEGFLQLEHKEIQALYDYFAHKKSLRTKDLKAYRWLTAFLKTRREQPRPF